MTKGVSVFHLWSNCDVMRTSGSSVHCFGFGDWMWPTLVRLIQIDRWEHNLMWTLPLTIHVSSATMIEDLLNCPTMASVSQPGSVWKWIFPRSWTSNTFVVQLHNTDIAKMCNVCMFDCMCYIYLSVANNDGVLNRQTMAAGSLAGYQWFHRATTVVHNGSTGIPMVDRDTTFSTSFALCLSHLGSGECNWETVGVRLGASTWLIATIAYQRAQVVKYFCNKY